MIAACLVFMILAAYAENVENQLPSASKDIYSTAQNGYDPKDRVYRQQKNGIQITRPDDDDFIERPCRVYDLNCIRKYFAEHARCNVTFGSVPDPLIRPQLTLYLPRINLTLTSIREEYRGLKGKIIEFYINNRTDKLVLAVDFNPLQTFSNNYYLRFHRVGREPLVTNDYFYVLYPSISSTIIIPHLNELQLQDSEVFTNSNTAGLPIFSVGPRAFGDPRLLPTLAAFLADINSNIQEAFLTESAFFMSSYIQYTLCDFGIKVL